MVKKKRIRQLYVYMNGIPVGILEQLTTGQLQFTYQNSWLSHEQSRPISLSMPLTEVSYKGGIVENYFDNLLPDSRTIRERIQIRFNAPSTKCFDLLSEIGADCVGAVQLLTKPQLNNTHKIIANPLNDHEIAKRLKGYKSAPLGMEQNSEFRISIAGAQEKTAFLWHKKQWNEPLGTTPTSHIFKLPIGKIEHANMDLSESIENEWLCLKILEAYGLPTSHSRICKFENINTLVVERFDRLWSKGDKWLMRLPQEDLCQALGKPAGQKYESDGGPGIKDIMDILTGAIEAVTDRKTFMKAIFLFWILGAIDGHAKNFSITIEANGRYRLTPLYDVISAYPLAAKRQLEWKGLKMAMALKAKNTHYQWSEIQLRHWFETAKICQFPEKQMQDIINEAFHPMDSVINTIQNTLPSTFPKNISESIFQGMKKVHSRITGSK